MRGRRWLLTVLLALPLAAAGVIYGQALVGSGEPEKSAPYICPLTGEELPCRYCCPINSRQ
jgi:hypothetical protein